MPLLTFGYKKTVASILDALVFALSWLSPSGGSRCHVVMQPYPKGHKSDLRSAPFSLSPALGQLLPQPKA